jgi:hypothetical protein
MRLQTSRLLPVVGSLAAALIVVAPVSAQTTQPAYPPTDGGTQTQNGQTPDTTGQPMPAQMGTTTQPMTTQPTMPAATTGQTTTAPAAPALAPAAAPAATAPTSGQSANSSGWVAGPQSPSGVTPTFSGSIDSPKTGSTVATSGTFDVNGWFVDTTAQGWAGADDVQLFLGQMGSGGTMLAKGVVAENRPDVGTALGNPYWAASGFSVAAPASSLPAGSDTLNLYVHTPGKGWWYQPLSVTASASAAPQTTTSTTPAAPTAGNAVVATNAPMVTINNPTENQDVSTKNDYTVAGSVSSPGAPVTDIDRIEVWINGERDSGTLLGTTTPESDGSWAVTFRPTNFSSTHSNLYVYAHSKSTGKETETVRGFNITDK